MIDFFLMRMCGCIFSVPLEIIKKSDIQKYADFFAKAIRIKSTVFTSSLILSEFFNSWFQMEYKHSFPDRTSKDYKSLFRNTPAYETAMIDVISTVKNRLMRYSKAVDDGFEIVDIDTLFADMARMDFNDKYHLAICERNRLTLVTNDSDYGNINTMVQILTANPKMLSNTMRS